MFDGYLVQRPVLEMHAVVLLCLTTGTVSTSAHVNLYFGLYKSKIATVQTSISSNPLQN
jgi:hypothetical protein